MSTPLHLLNKHPAPAIAQGQHTVYLSGSIPGDKPSIEHLPPPNKPTGKNPQQQPPKTPPPSNNTRNEINHGQQLRGDKTQSGNHSNTLLLDKQITDSKTQQSKVLEAKVLAVQNKLVSGHPVYKTTLQIGNQHMEATSDKALAVGSLIKLKILNNKALQILSVQAIENNSQINKMITDSIRHYLPVQNNIGSLMRQLLYSKATATTSQLSGTSSPTTVNSSLSANSLTGSAGKISPSGNHQALQLTNSIEKLITGFMAKIPQATQLATGKGFKQAFRNSGIFLEHRLANPLPSTNTDLLSDQKAKLLQLFKNLLNLIANNKQLIPLPSKIEQSTNMAEIIKLLTQQILLQNKSSGKAFPHITAGNNFSKNPAGLISLVKDLTLSHLMGSPTNMNGPDTITGEKADNSILNLLKLIIGNVARTQLQQSLHIQQQTNTEPGPVNNWLTDIAVKTSDNVDIFQTHIEEYDSKGKEEEQSDGKLFKVTLAFDLFPLGPMYVQISYHNNNVSTIFWTENLKTFSQVQNELKTLNKTLTDQGIVVDKLHCKQGSPVIKATKLEQHLVDINIR